MRKEIIFRMKSPHRDDMRITAYHFGSGYRSVCIVGALRGNEIQQMYVCSQLIDRLKNLEEAGLLEEGVQITVIPSVNHFSGNLKKRFWTIDNTDINRMFPGYDKGETTQRIASAIFEYTKNYRYGIHFVSYHMEGEFVPHVRSMVTGYQDNYLGKIFGLKYILELVPTPFDTTTLNYNWQLWNLQAFSLYTKETKTIDEESAEIGVDAVLRFMKSKKMVNIPMGKEAAVSEIAEKFRIPEGLTSEMIHESDMVTLRAEKAGFYMRVAGQGDRVNRGDVLAKIVHPYEGNVIHEVKSPVDGEVFFAHRAQLTMEHQVLFKVIKKNNW